MKKITLSLFSLLALALTAGAQQYTLTQTTLTAAVATTDKAISVNSATGLVAPTFGSVQGSQIYIDGEVMRVTAISGTTISVARGGQSGTGVNAHANNAIVWLGAANLFYSYAPSGSCTLSTTYVAPWIDVAAGRIYTCSAAQGVWGTEAAFFVPPSACQATVSGTAGSGNNTVIVDGSVAALKASSTNASASNATFTCSFQPPPAAQTAGKGAAMTDATYLYSVQTTTATSMVASTFKSFTAPAAGASETASSATLVAAGGTLTHLPVVASANLTAVSAGQYYSEKVSFGTPELLTTDLKTYTFTAQINQSASAAQIVTLAGIWVHYTVPVPFI